MASTETDLEGGPSAPDTLQSPGQRATMDEDDGAQPMRQVLRYPSDNIRYLVPPKPASVPPNLDTNSSSLKEDQSLQKETPLVPSVNLPKVSQVTFGIPETNELSHNSPGESEDFVKMSTELLPWDKIAIGTILLDENDSGGNQLKTSQLQASSTRPEPQPLLSSSTGSNPQAEHTTDHSLGQAQVQSHPPTQRQDWSQSPRPMAHPENPESFRSQPPPSEPILIDVGFGNKVPLRGSDETWKAIESGQVTITKCLTCQIDLNCLENAKMVICPDCTMISPVDQSGQNGEQAEEGRYGVGVGVKPADVLNWIQGNA